MHTYYNTPSIVYSATDSMGRAHEVISPSALSQFKSQIETHLQSLTASVQNLESHAGYLSKEISETQKLLKWLGNAHPDIIDAYKKSTAVVETLDRANANVDEYMYPQTAA